MSKIGLPLVFVLFTAISILAVDAPRGVRPVCGGISIVALFVLLDRFSQSSPDDGWD